MTIFKVISAQVSGIVAGIVIGSTVGMVVGNAGHPILAIFCQIIACVVCYTRIPAWILKEELEALKSELPEDKE